SLPGVMLQYDWEGACLFQHRNFAKWQLHGSNRRIAGFTHETDCLQFLAELRTRWTELPPGVRRFQFEHKTAVEREAATRLCARQWIYRRMAHEERPMLFEMDGHISIGSAGCERYWDIRLYDGKMYLEIFSGVGKTLAAEKVNGGSWKGRWLIFERMPIEIAPFTDESHIALRAH